MCIIEKTENKTRIKRLISPLLMIKYDQECFSIVWYISITVLESRQKSPVD